MRKHIIVISSTLLFVAVALTVSGQGTDSLAGRWRTNFAKSTYSPGPPPTLRSQTSTWESLGGGQYRNAIDGVDVKGQPTPRLEITLRFDGADYEFKGADQPTTRAYTRIDARTWEYVQKVNGKAVNTSRSVLSPDGKTRTLTTTGTNIEGKPVKNVVIWEKQ